MFGEEKRVRVDLHQRVSVEGRGAGGDDLAASGIDRVVESGMATHDHLSVHAPSRIGLPLIELGPRKR